MAKISIFGSIERTLQAWMTNLKNLTFGDNFQSFEWEGIILSGQQMQITHNLKVKPTRFLVLDIRGGTINRGSKPATQQFFYVENTHVSEDFTGKILIMP